MQLRRIQPVTRRGGRRLMQAAGRRVGIELGERLGRLFRHCFLRFMAIDAAELLEQTTASFDGTTIQLGRIEAFGAVQKARLGFYHQKTRKYQSFVLDRPFEITKLIGNISLKEGKSIVHAHITLAGEDGSAYGGHLLPGTIVFACEFIVQVFEGPIFQRGLDLKTGLPLWKME